MKNSNKKNLYKSIILFIILVIGIGYAYLTSNLSISGQTEVVANTWNIHFENLNVKGGSVITDNPAIINSDNTIINYLITLSRPKDYYEFTVDVKNDGTLPGKVSISTLSGLDTASSKVIDYSIKYTNGNLVNVGDILNAGAKKTIKVRVYYKDDISESDFPSNNLNLNLTYTLQYVQSEESEFDTNALVEQLKTDNSSCFTKYEGEVTDQVGQTVTASNVYFNKCADKRNIKFNNMCWQMIRTTETGGIKMVYNGDVVGGKCENTRGDHKGFVGNGNNQPTLSDSYLYGSSFTYDVLTNEFTLTDTITSTWSDSTYENLIGKFTCKNTTGKCGSLFNINSYLDGSHAYASSYTIDDTNYAQIGIGPFNVYYNSPAMVGYMFNKVYNYKSGSPTSGSLMGNDVSYSNGIYTLLPASGENALGTTKDATHHYTCNNTIGTCSKVRFYYNNNNYIELDGAENIQAAVNEMLYNDNVNTYNSSIKGIIDSWYAQNLSSKTNMLEDTVYCNARDMTNQSTNGWNKDGSLSTYMYFKNYSLNNDLSCPNETDQFAVSNSKAKLTYPVGLVTHEELYTLTNNDSSDYYDTLTKTNVGWWGISPYGFDNFSADIRNVSTSGGIRYNAGVSSAIGIRFVITLSTGSVISKGDGSETNPWIIE